MPINPAVMQMLQGAMGPQAHNPGPDQMAQLAAMPPAQALALAQLKAQQSGSAQEQAYWTNIVQQLSQAAQAQRQAQAGQAAPGPGAQAALAVMPPAPAGIDPAALIRGTLGPGGGGGY